MELPSSSDCVMSNVRTVQVKVAASTSCRPIGGAEVQLHSVLTSALNGVEWPSSCGGSFTPANAPPPNPGPTEQWGFVGTGAIWKFWRREKSPSTVRFPNRPSLTAVVMVTKISRRPQMVQNCKSPEIQT